MLKTSVQLAENVLWRSKYAALVEGDTRSRTPIYGDLAEVRERLNPGDIILGKEFKAFHSAIPKVISKVTNSPWTHTGVYLGDNRVGHFSTSLVKGKGLKYRSNTLDNFVRNSKGLLVVRPRNVSEEQQEEAVRLTKKLRKTKYSVVDFVRSGFYPKKEDTPRKERHLLKGLGNTLICSGAVAAAYPDFKFRGDVHRKHVRPSDFATSKAVRQVMAYSAGHEGQSKKAFDYCQEVVLGKPMEKIEERPHVKAAEEIAFDILEKLAASRGGMVNSLHNQYHKLSVIPASVARNTSVTSFPRNAIKAVKTAPNTGMPKIPTKKTDTPSSSLMAAPRTPSVSAPKAPKPLGASTVHNTSAKSTMSAAVGSPSK